MAEFFKPQGPPSEAVPNFGNNSAGPRQANTGSAIAIQGFGQTLARGLDALDKNNLRNIDREVYAQTDNLNTEMGVDDATLMNAPADTKILPSAIQSAGRNLESLQQAYQRGEIDERYYWTRANSISRQLRAKYPGYRQEIDAKVASVTGGNPANQIRNSMLQEAEEAKRAERSAADKAEQRRYSLINDMAGSGYLPAGWSGMSESERAAYSTEELLTIKNKREAEKSQIAMDKSRLELADKQGQLSREDTKRTFQGEFSGKVNNILNDISDPRGKLYQSIQQRIKQGGKLTAEEIASLTQEYGQLEAEVNRMFQQSIHARFTDDPNSGTYASKLDKKDLDDAYALAIKPLAEIKQALTDGDIGVVNRTINFNKNLQEDQTRVLLQDPRLTPLTVVGVANRLWGPAAAQQIIGEAGRGPDADNAILNSIKHINTAYAVDTATGGGLTQGGQPIKAFSESLPDIKNNPRAIQGHFANIKQIEVAARTGSITPEVLAPLVSFYTKDPQVLQKFSPEARAQVFNRLAAPGLVEQMGKAKDANPEGWMGMKRLITEGSRSVFATSLRTLNTYNSDRRLQQVVFNPQTQQLVLVRNPNPAKSITNAREGNQQTLEGMGVYGWAGRLVNWALDDSKEVEASLKDINTVLLSVSAMAKADGVDPSAAASNYLGSVLGSVEGLTEGSVASQISSALPPIDETVSGYFESNTPFIPRFQDPVVEPGVDNTGEAPGTRLDTDGYTETTDDLSTAEPVSSETERDMSMGEAPASVAEGNEQFTSQAEGNEEIITEATTTATPEATTEREETFALERPMVRDRSRPDAAIISEMRASGASEVEIREALEANRALRKEAQLQNTATQMNRDINRQRIASNNGPSGTGAGVTGEVGSIIDRVASEAGEDASVLKRIAMLESSGNPNARSPLSSAGGLFQFIDGTAKQYGLANRFDPEQATRAAARLMKDNRTFLERRLGRKAEGWELYLAHQQGAGNAAKLLANPNALAKNLLGEKALVNNLPASQKRFANEMTAAEFSSIWRNKFAGGRSSQAAAATPAVKTPDVEPIVNPIPLTQGPTQQPSGEPVELEKGNMDTGTSRLINAVSGRLLIMVEEIDGEQVIIPLVDSEGKTIDSEKAKDLYRTSGKHLGKYSTRDAALAQIDRLNRVNQ